METIKKEFDFGVLKIEAKINDGVVALVTNNPQVTKQIYLQAVKGKKIVFLRGNVVIQKYPDFSKEQILEIVNKEIEGAYQMGDELKKKLEEKK